VNAFSFKLSQMGKRVGGHRFSRLGKQRISRTVGEITETKQFLLGPQFQVSYGIFQAYFWRS
jgi:hypothetical protein